MPLPRPRASASVCSMSRVDRPLTYEEITRLSSALVLVTPLPKRREAKGLVGAPELGSGELHRPCGGLDRHRGVARVTSRLVMQTALEAEVTEFLGRERYAREVTLRRKKLVNLGADALGGGRPPPGLRRGIGPERALATDTRFTDVVSFSLACRLLIGAYVRRLSGPVFTPEMGRYQSSSTQLSQRGPTASPHTFSPQSSYFSWTGSQLGGDVRQSRAHQEGHLRKPVALSRVPGTEKTPGEAIIFGGADRR